MTQLIFFVVCVAPVLKLHNAGQRKWSLQFLDYLGEYKILPSFSLPKSRQKLMNIIMDGRKQQGNTTIKQNQNKNHLHLWVHVMAVAPTLPIVTWAG